MNPNTALLQMRYTAAQFASYNPTPADGQICVETDGYMTKVGDGSTPYLSLGFVGFDPASRREFDLAYQQQIHAQPTSITRYVARIAQAGTNAPTVDVLFNDTPYTPAWIYSGSGLYEYTGTPGTEVVRLSHPVIALPGDPPVGYAFARGQALNTIDPSGAQVDNLLDFSGQLPQVVEMTFYPPHG